ncbi:hypothetical protein CLU79DRAFT_752140 [Phycomyces nitens]|nr:hypothetical protein CLU79DRAFT_752140 [Phycomyces nitens]
MDLCDGDEADTTVTQCTHCNPTCPTQTAIISQTKEIRDLRQQLKTQTEAFERLQLDISTLNQKYVAAIERVADVQHEKDLVVHELEELSRKLFEEANGMVATEKREKWELENQLRQTQEYLVAEQCQLTELKQRMQAMLVSEDNLDTQDDPRARAQKDLQELYGVKRASTNPTLYRKHISSDPSQRVTSMPPLQSPKPQRTITIDEFQLDKFREYLNSSRSVSVKKLSQFAYLKYCQAEDIEPCLRFGPQSRLSVKKMMDYLMRQPCFIEQMPLLDPNLSKPTPSISTASTATQRPIWERFSNSKPLDGGCSACGRLAGQDCALKYRFKLDSGDPWLPIDEYCRDRLVAVCEFYVFLRNIQLGLYSDRPIQDLYAENIRLRLQMFYSR